MPRRRGSVVPFRWKRRRWTQPDDYWFGSRASRKSWRQAWRETRLWVLGIAVLTVAAVGGMAVRGGSEPLGFVMPKLSPAQAAAPAYPDVEHAQFTICSGPIRVDCVVDGDTFWYRGEKIRIADINTPEVGEPQCAYEAQLGADATWRLLALLNEGPFTLETIDRDRDRYGRLLRNVTRYGESLGDTLVREGLAEEWTGSRRSWCER